MKKYLAIVVSVLLIAVSNLRAATSLLTINTQGETYNLFYAACYPNDLNNPTADNFFFCDNGGDYYNYGVTMAVMLEFGSGSGLTNGFYTDNNTDEYTPRGIPFMNFDRFAGSVYYPKDVTGTFTVSNLLRNPDGTINTVNISFDASNTSGFAMNGNLSMINIVPEPSAITFIGITFLGVFMYRPRK